MPNIEQGSGSKLHLEETEMDDSRRLSIVIRAPAESTDAIVKNVTQMLEDVLVGIIDEESRGRLLYDMALACNVDIRSDGAVLQRNPLNSADRVWMCVVDFPTYVIEGVQKHFVIPSIDGKSYDEIHNAKCTLKICKDNFNVKLSRCKPYALILGKQVKNVSAAIVVIKNAIKRFRQISEVPSLQSLTVTSSRTLNDHMPLFGVSNRSRAQFINNARKVAIPMWLVSDPNFRERVRRE